MKNPTGTTASAPIFHADGSCPGGRVLWLAGALLALVFLGFALCRDLRSPWNDDDNYNGAFWSQAAHNFLGGGFLQTRGVPAPLYAGPLPVPTEDLYLHHPTLLPALVAVLFKIFGESELTARLLPLGCTLAVALSLWLLVFQCAGVRPAALALALFAVQPMVLHYGSMVNFEPLELMWIAAAFPALHHWRASGSAAWRRIFLACLVLAMMTEWVGYLIAAILAVRLFLRGDPGEKSAARWLLILMLLCFAGTMLQLDAANPEGLRESFGAFFKRMGNSADTAHAAAGHGSFGWLEWGRKVGGDLRELFTPAILLLAFAGAALCIVSSRARRAVPGPVLEMAGCIFLLHFCYVTGFRNASYIHDFAHYYATIPAALMGAVCLEGALRFFCARSRMAGGLLTGAVCILCLVLAGENFAATAAMRSPFLILDGETPEPPGLMPKLGAVIREAFPPGTTVLTNFDPYGSPLQYYARHQMVNHFVTRREWEAFAGDAGTPVGGIVWMNAPGADALAAGWAAPEKKMVTVEGVPFCLWRAGS